MGVVLVAAPEMGPEEVAAAEVGQAAQAPEVPQAEAVVAMAPTGPIRTRADLAVRGVVAATMVTMRSCYRTALTQGMAA